MGQYRASASGLADAVLASRQAAHTAWRRTRPDVCARIRAARERRDAAIIELVEFAKG